MPNKTDKSADFMLKEYDRIHQLWMDENAQAEKRVGFFITFAPTVIAASILVLRFQLINNATAPYFIGSVCFILFLIGTVIQNRLTQRTVQLNAYRRGLASIRNYFFDQFDDLSNHKKMILSIWSDPEGNEWYRRWINGSLSGLIGICNAVLVGGFVTSSVVSIGFTNAISIIASASIGFVIGCFTQIRCHRELKKFLRPWKIF